MDATGAPAAGQPASAIETQQAERGQALGTVDVLDEHPCRGEEVSGGLLEKHVPRMKEWTSLTTFLMSDIT